MEKVILGIDPGTNVMGYGIIRIAGKELSVVDLGVIELQKIKSPYEKLHAIAQQLTSIVELYSPNEMALEAPFYGKNVQSMLKLGRAQGVAMSVGLTHGMPISEYAPRKVKLSITGTGAASKEQVAAFVSKILHYEVHEKYLDATDALAVAICHYFEISKPIALATGTMKAKIPQKKSSQSWGQFIAQHSDRVIK